MPCVCGSVGIDASASLCKCLFVCVGMCTYEVLVCVCMCVSAGVCLCVPTLVSM